VKANVDGGEEVFNALTATVDAVETELDASRMADIQ